MMHQIPTDLLRFAIQQALLAPGDISVAAVHGRLAERGIYRLVAPVRDLFRYKYHQSVHDSFMFTIELTGAPAYASATDLATLRQDYIQHAIREGLSKHVTRTDPFAERMRKRRAEKKV